MEYAVVLVALGLVVSVRAFTAMALNKQEPRPRTGNSVPKSPPWRLRSASSRVRRRRLKRSSSS